MLICISPTKTMMPTRSRVGVSVPAYVEEAKQVRNILATMSEEAYVKLVGSKLLPSKALFEYPQPVGEAGFTYNGIQFKYLDVHTLDERALHYLQAHLRILSGVYGVLKLTDTIEPYRLEMQARLYVEQLLLKEYWKNHYATYFEGETVLNLASKEYGSLLPKSATVIEVAFFTRKQGKLTSQATYSKMMRGMMVRYLAQHHISTIEEVKDFQEGGYRYSSSESTLEKMVFIKEEEYEAAR
ncbi:MAG: YaaA family protein [Erysipelotrichaceae bacterium]